MDPVKAVRKVARKVAEVVLPELPPDLLSLSDKEFAPFFDEIKALLPSNDNTTRQSTGGYVYHSPATAPKAAFFNSYASLPHCCGAIEVGSFYGAKKLVPGMTERQSVIYHAHTLRGRLGASNMLLATTSHTAPGYQEAAEILKAIGFKEAMAATSCHGNYDIRLWAWGRKAVNGKPQVGPGS